MPEQLTKHPEVTLQVLRSAGAVCGQGEAQTILTACPADRFCKLPGGEICVYGLPEAGRMTQISAGEWQAALQQMPAEMPPEGLTPWGLGATLAALLAGLVAGHALGRRRRGPPA